MMMDLKNLLVIGLFILMGLVSINASAETVANPDIVIKPIIEDYIDDVNPPGIAMVVFYQGRSYFYNWGVLNKSTNQPVNQDTIFEIGSITKVFTSTLLAQEVLNQKIKLSDPVTEYLPPWVAEQEGAIKQVTLEQLATHTSSLPRVPPFKDDEQPYSKNDVLHFIASWQPKAAIGTRWHYSNLGFGVLGYALENATQQEYLKLVQKNILIPLAMTHTSIAPTDLANYAQGYKKSGKPVPHWPVSAWLASGALRSSTTDLNKFLQANLGIIGPENLIKAMQFSQQGYFQTAKFMQGLGWQISPQGIINKNGGTSGFSTVIALYPPQKVGVVILVNQTKANPTPVALAIVKNLILKEDR